MKTFYFDVETSGLDPIQNDILTLAGIIEIDGEVKEEFYLEMQPFNYDTISKEALVVNGLTIEQIKTFQRPQEAHKKLQSIFSKYINRYNKLDKLTAIGHNVGFDMRFLNSLFRKCGDKYFGSWIDYHFLDTMVLLNLLKFNKVIQIDNVKLVTAAKHFGVELTEAHNAMADIKATRELFQKLIERIDFK
jgi:DNA polymerase-3 subunit epsilon